MKVTDFFRKSSKPAFSLEITPPLKIKSVDKIFQVIDRVQAYHPDFINITYHQEAITWEDIDGLKTKAVYQKHASSVGVCAAIKYKYGLEVVPHFICGGFNKLESEDALFDLIFLGINNVFALRGDPRKNQECFTPEPNGHKYASELVSQIRSMQNNHYLHQLHPKEPADFCIGVAGYPEKHIEAHSLSDDIKWLKHKVDCGADYIVTQMLFDFEKFTEWEKLCREAGIHVPIIPGLKPITEKKQIRRFMQNFGVHFPDSFVLEMENSSSSVDAYNCGIKFMTELSEKLLNYGSPGIHYFTMGNGEDVAAVARNIFGK